MTGSTWHADTSGCGSQGSSPSRPSLKHPACGSAVESQPQAGLVSPASLGGHTDEQFNRPTRPGPVRGRPRQPASGWCTNVRRIAGGERAPGSVLIGSAAWLLALVGAGALYVSFSAQRQYVFGARHQDAASIIEALLLDVLLIVFTLLALGLSRAGKSSRTERALILACAIASAYMNVSDADTASPRSVVAYAVAPVALAVVVDRVVAVIRRHVLGVDEASAWTSLGRAVVAAARLSGARPALLAAVRPGAVVDRQGPAPLGPGRDPAAGVERPALTAAEVPAIEPPPVTEPPELEGASKKARLAWWYRQDPDFGNRPLSPRWLSGSRRRST